MPVLQIRLGAGERIVAEPGEFSWMTETTAAGVIASGILENLFGK